MQVLVLSETFQPLYTCGAERAILLLFRGKAVSVQDSDDVMRSPSMVIRVPRAIRLLVKAMLHHCRAVYKPNRQGIFRRDKGVCQYCGCRGNITIDHVMPKSRGGGDTWENLVTACFACNNKKGNKNPEEAGMRLLRPPKAPRALEMSIELYRQLWNLTQQ